MKCVLALLVLFGSSAAPALAQDEQRLAPPGNAGVEELLEVVPAAGGDRPAGGLAAPTPRAARARSKALGSSGPPDSIAAPPGGARGRAVADALAGGGGGMGLAFPLVLLGSLAAALGLLVIRGRTRRE